MSREKIAVDIDEVLFPFMPHFLDYHNQQNGTNIVAEQLVSYRFEVDLDVPLEEALDYVYSFSATDHTHIQPIEDAKDAIGQLGEQYDLSIVTARHPQFEVGTLDWIGKHFPGVFSSVDFIGYAAAMENARTKSEVCHNLGAVALIDDSPGHVNQCADEGLSGVLFGEYPWNTQYDISPGVTRCKDWRAVLEHFNA